MDTMTGTGCFSGDDNMSFSFGQTSFNFSTFCQLINADGSLLVNFPLSPSYNGSSAGWTGQSSANPISWWQTTITSGVEEEKKSYLRKFGKTDVLFEFFSKDIHGLITISEDGAKVIPFMDRFGMIWLMEGENQWAAFDKPEFHKFLNDEKATDYYGPKLNKQQVMERLADPGDNKE